MEERGLHVIPFNFVVKQDFIVSGGCLWKFRDELLQPFEMRWDSSAALSCTAAMWIDFFFLNAPEPWSIVRFSRHGWLEENWRVSELRPGWGLPEQLRLACSPSLRTWGRVCCTLQPFRSPQPLTQASCQQTAGSSGHALGVGPAMEQPWCMALSYPE